MAARMSRPTQLTLVNANDAKQLDGADGRRARFLIQNLGPGNVFWSTDQEGPPAAGGTLGGIRIVPGATWIDDPPFSHCGPIYVAADTGGTLIVFSKWV